MAQYKPDPSIDDSTRLVIIEKAIFDMTDRLFGNGQPGEIASIWGEITKVREEGRRAVGGLKTKMAYLAGAGGGLIVILQIVYYSSPILKALGVIK